MGIRVSIVLLFSVRNFLFLSPCRENPFCDVMSCQSFGLVANCNKTVLFLRALHHPILDPLWVHLRYVILLSRWLVLHVKCEKVICVHFIGLIDKPTTPPFQCCCCVCVLFLWLLVLSLLPCRRLNSSCNMDRPPNLLGCWAFGEALYIPMKTITTLLLQSFCNFFQVEFGPIVWLLQQMLLTC